MLKTQDNLASSEISKRTTRIFELYEAWNAELDAIGEEVRHLRGEIQKVIDKKQMYRILQELNERHQ